MLVFAVLTSTTAYVNTYIELKTDFASDITRSMYLYEQGLTFCGRAVSLPFEHNCSISSDFLRVIRKLHNQSEG